MERTLEAYMSLFEEDHQHLLPLFKMELILDEDSDNIQFYPAMEDLEDSIINGAHVILRTLHNIPTVQSWLSGGITTVNIDTTLEV